MKAGWAVRAIKTCLLEEIIEIKLIGTRLNERIQQHRGLTQRDPKKSHVQVCRSRVLN